MKYPACSILIGPANSSTLATPTQTQTNTGIESVMSVSVAPSSSPLPAAARGQEASRILVVDDDDFFRDREETVLDQAGYKTMTAADGAAALALLRSGSFDLLLTDLQMPQLGGVGLIRALRAFDRHLPVMVVSGSLVERDELPPDLRGEVEIALPKYADSKQLLAAVAQALRSPRTTTPAIELKIDDRRGVEGEKLRKQETAGTTPATGSLFGSRTRTAESCRSRD